MFLAIQDQINEYDGEFDEVDDDLDMLNTSFGSSSDTVSVSSIKLLQQKKAIQNSSKKEPALAQVQIDAVTGALTVETVNTKSVIVKYCIIDAEMLFSRAPFLNNNASEFSYVKPFHQLTHKMLPDEPTQQQMSQYVTETIELPEKLHNSNLVIEVDGAGK